jgi:hypothetical protein
MAHESLQRPRIDSPSRQGVASSMPQHVGMDREGQLGGLAKPFYELLRAIHGERSFPLGQEHEVGMWMLPPQCPQQPKFVALQAMDTGRAVLGAADIDGRGVEMDLLPANILSSFSISGSVRYSRCR